MVSSIQLSDAESEPTRNETIRSSSPLTILTPLLDDYGHYQGCNDAVCLAQNLRGKFESPDRPHQGPVQNVSVVKAPTVHTSVVVGKRVLWR